MSKGDFMSIYTYYLCVKEKAADDDSGFSLYDATNQD